MILLLELFQPTRAVRFEVAVRVTHSRSEEASLVPDNSITERQTLPLVVSRPIRKRTFNVGEFSFRSFDG
jgi:hypothetical protein